MIARLESRAPSLSKIWAFKRVLLEIISAARTGLPEYKKILTLRPCEDRL